MPNSTCIDQSFFSITGDPFYSGKQVNFQLAFDSPTDQEDVLACQWYLNGVLVKGKEQNSFTDTLNCGTYTIGARILSSSGWSGIKTFQFQTCKVPLNYTIIGPPALREGAIAEYRVVLNYSDGSLSDVTADYTFSADYGAFSGNVYNVQSNTIALDSRQALISATKNGSGALTKTIEIIDATPRTLTSLRITGPDAVKEGDNANFAVTATYADGSTSDFTADYMFYCKDGSFLGGSFIAFKDATEGNTRTSSVIALKHGIPQLLKSIQIVDVKPAAGVLVVDMLGTGNIDVIGMIGNTEIAGGGLLAYTGKNIVLSEAAPANAFILASDLISQAGSTLNWRFEFNIRKLLSAYPNLTEFVFQIKGRGVTAGTINGVYSLKSTDALMTIQGESGSFIPAVSVSDPAGIIPFSSVLASGANGSHLKEDLASIIQFTYHVATSTLTTLVPQVTSTVINGPDTINEGASATYSVAKKYDNGIVLNDTSLYNFSCSEGSFNGPVLSIPSNEDAGDSRSALITAIEGNSDPLTRSITIVDKSTYVSIEITGPAIVNEGSSNNYKVIGNYSNGTKDDLTSGYTFSSTEGSFAGVTLSIAVNNIAGDDRSTTITAAKAGAATLTRQISIVDSSTIIIKEFDYMVVRYIWAEGSGRDLDIMVGFEGNETPIDSQYIGWNNNMGNDGKNRTIPMYTQPESGAKLWWAFDNRTTAGVEGVLIGIKSFIDTYPQSPNIIKVGLYAVWWGAVESGDFQLKLETYKDGSMTTSDTNFINIGGHSVSSNTKNLNTKIQNNNSNVRTSYKAGVLNYNKALQTATIQFFDNWA
jgi:hypothetical protein